MVDKATDGFEAISHTDRRRMMKELLYHQEAINRASFEQPYIHDLDDTHGASYTDMRADPTVSSALEILTEAVLAEEPIIEPAAQTRGALAVADYAEKMLLDADVGNGLQTGLEAIWRGFSAQEITWRMQGKHRVLDCLADLSEDQITLDLDDRMRVLGIVSKPIGHDPQRVPAAKLWMHLHNGSRTHPAGRSILDNVYRAWTAKDKLLKYWGLALQRFGMPFIIGQVPENMSSTQQQAILTALYGLLLDGIALLPETIAYQIHNPVQWANLTFEKAIDYQNDEIYRGILLQHVMAQGQTHTAVPGISAQEIAKATNYRLARTSRALASSFNQQVLAPIVIDNFGANPDIMPRLRLPEPDAARLVALAPTWQALVSTGIADPQTAADELGLPKPTPRAQIAPGSTQRGATQGRPIE